MKNTLHVAALLCVIAGCSNDPVRADDAGPIVISDPDACCTDVRSEDAAADGGADVHTEPEVGEGEADAAVDEDAATDPKWAAVQAELEASFANSAAGAPGMTLIVYDAEDRRVFESTVGDFDADRRVAVASASKLVSGLVLMRLISDPSVNLTLDTTVGEVLPDWLSEQGMINLDQLGAFTSGLPANAPCLRQADTTLAECVATLADAPLSDAPGSDFAYGATHLQVAARVAEVATGDPWQTLFDEQLAAPLGISDPGLRYLTFPRAELGTTNPLVAGGLRASANEYVHFLRLLFHQGTVDGVEHIDATAMERFRQNLYTNADIVRTPHAATGLDFRYGWASWLECEGGVATCDVVSSPGAFGFTPWVDFGAGYYAVLAMEAPEAGAGFEGSVIAQRLRPLVEAALLP